LLYYATKAGEKPGNEANAKSSTAFGEPENEARSNLCSKQLVFTDQSKHPTITRYC